MHGYFKKAFIQVLLPCQLNLLITTIVYFRIQLYIPQKEFFVALSPPTLPPIENMKKPNVKS